MARTSPIVRLLVLLHAMAQSKRGVVLKQLADRKGWPLRALYRDMKVLASAGVPVGHAHGRYWLVEGWTLDTFAGAGRLAAGTATAGPGQAKARGLAVHRNTSPSRPGE